MLRGSLRLFPLIHPTRPAARSGHASDGVDSEVASVAVAPAVVVVAVFYRVEVEVCDNAAGDGNGIFVVLGEMVGHARHPADTIK